MALEILKVQEATIISNEKNIKDLKKVIEQLLKSIIVSILRIYQRKNLSRI